MAITWNASPRGSSERADIGIGHLVLTVQQELVSKGQTAKFEVRVFGALLKNKPETMEEAKALAERAAKTYLKIALTKLG